MANEKIRVVRGPVVTIRPTAIEAAKAGDLYRGGRATGFWLHDTAKGEVGDVCIAARLVSVPMKKGTYVAGDVALGGRALIWKPTLQQLRGDSPGVVAVLYRDVVLTRSGRALAVWGQH